MQIVSITRNTLVFDSDDWKRLNTLMTDFDKICDSQSCKTCPLRDFCDVNPNPADYLKCLYEFLAE